MLTKIIFNHHSHTVRKALCQTLQAPCQQTVQTSRAVLIPTVRFHGGLKLRLPDQGHTTSEDPSCNQTHVLHKMLQQSELSNRSLKDNTGIFKSEFLPQGTFTSTIRSQTHEESPRNRRSLTPLEMAGGDF